MITKILQKKLEFISFFWDKLTGGNDSEKSDSSDRYYTPKKTSITRNNDVKPNIVNNPSSTNYYATVNVNQNQA